MALLVTVFFMNEPHVPHARSGSDELYGVFKDAYLEWRRMIVVRVVLVQVECGYGPGKHPGLHLSSSPYMV